MTSGSGQLESPVVIKREWQPHGIWRWCCPAVTVQADPVLVFQMLEM